MRLLISLFLVSATVLAERPKEKDQAGQRLISIPDIGEGCDRSAQHGFGIVDGYVEHCEKWTEAQNNATLKAEYEAYKCSHLRLKARVTDGVCSCQSNWYGAFCHLSALCDKGTNKTSRAWFNGKCTPNACYNDGTIAVGKNMVECICPVPWDGRHCERLACWRKTDPENERRYRNDKGACVCGVNYKGDNCDQITSCEHGGNFTGSSCDCPLEWYGEICERKKVCTTDKTTGEKVCKGSTVTQIGLLALFVALIARW
ncbi:unnamed protein product, partial [Mesorhabditis spiculigera]